MLAIHENLRDASFQQRWVNYCTENNIPYKLVDSFSNDIINELKGCSAYMWHFHQGDAKDIVMAKQLLFSLEQNGLTVFPDFNTAWHFDDKVGQKYLLEALGIDLVKTWIFYDESTSLKWINQSTFPKVFKLRGGAGSQNVQLVRTKEAAHKLVKKAFGKGFPAYDGFGSLQERFRKWKSRKAPFAEVIKGIVRLVYPPRYAKVMGNEINYLYFQEFVPNNDSDTRIIVIDGKAFGIKRMNRENDFKASGSGFIRYDKASIDEIFVRTSFEINKKLKAQCVAYDFVLDENKIPLLIEISYGFANAGYNDCPGYWDENLVWYEGKFNPYGWMVDLVLKQSNEK
jgi:glutathione synthase/RimK-type ligase-like ATP-grasp enzyme